MVHNRSKSYPNDMNRKCLEELSWILFENHWGFLCWYLSVNSSRKRLISASYTRTTVAVWVLKKMKGEGGGGIIKSEKFVE